MEPTLDLLEWVLLHGKWKTVNNSRMGVEKLKQLIIGPGRKQSNFPESGVVQNERKETTFIVFHIFDLTVFVNSKKSTENVVALIRRNLAADAEILPKLAQSIHQNKALLAQIKLVC